MPAKRSYKRGAKVTDFLKDEDFRRWWEQLGNGSSSTADSWSRRLRGFCQETKTTPKGLLQQDGKELRDLFIDYIGREQRRGSAGSYIAYSLKVVRSWLRFNDHEAPSRLKVRDSDRVVEETALSQLQLAAVLDTSTAREKVAITLMAMSGVRPEVLGNFLGTDGLKVADLPELQINGWKVSLAHIPTVIVVRRELSKAGHVYRTFLSAEGVAYLTNYLEARLRSHERLSPASPVITPERAKKPFIRTTNIGDMVRGVLRRTGFRQDRPYALRTTFATRLMTCENQGRVPHSFAVYWMGHTGDMTARYSVNRGKLPESLIEEMRGAYRRCEGELGTGRTMTETDKDESYRRALILMLRSKGMTDEELHNLKADVLPVGDLEREVLGRIGSNERRQQAVAVGDVKGLLEQGYEYVAPLGPDQAIVLTPNGNGHAGLPTPGVAPRNICLWHVPEGGSGPRSDNPRVGNPLPGFGAQSGALVGSLRRAKPALFELVFQGT